MLLAPTIAEEEAEAQKDDARQTREFYRMMWNDPDRRGVQQFGRCADCGRIDTGEEKLSHDGERVYLKPLYVTGRTPDKLQCLDCYIREAEEGAAKQKAQREKRAKAAKQCPHCTKSYASRAGLLRHAKKEHKGKEV